MSTKVEIPQLGESVTEAILGRWLKGDGERVSIDDPICELETDKANVELPAPAAGVLRRIVKEGSTVRIGEAVAQIDVDSGAATGEAKKAAPAPKGSEASAPKAASGSNTPPAGSPHADLSPAVRKLVDENHLDTNEISRSGPGDRITKEDVLAYLEKRQGVGNGKEAGAPAASSPSPSAPKAAAPVALKQPARPVTPSSTPGMDVVERVPMTKIRKKIAERLVQAQHQAAMLTTFNEVDMSAVLALRKKYKDRFTEIHGVSLGLMSFFARAVSLALKEFPVVNASIEGDDIVYHHYVHLGVAVSTERGLVVPVLRNADTMSFAKIESEIKRVAVSAREGKLGLQELSGGTFTITNGGVFGSMLSTPILNAPQSAILGMHATQNRPVAVGDKVEIHPVMYVALSYDHRIIDGKDSVSFLVRVKEYLEDPTRLMLEV